MKDARTILAIAIFMAIFAALWLQSRYGANVAPAVPYHYPCVMHLAGHEKYEWFTPDRLFWRGFCQQ